MKFKTVLLLIFVSTCLSAQASISDFNWLLGTWKLQTEKYDSFEKWTPESETIISGISYIVKGEQKFISEQLQIQLIHDHIVYIASPTGNSPTLFTLNSSSNGKYIFENPEHDFPQRIIYESIDENNLKVSIDGNENGKYKIVEFPFRRVE